VKPAAKMLAMWGLLIALFIAIWQLFAPADGRDLNDVYEHGDFSSLPFVVGTMLVALVGVLAWTRYWKRFGAAARVLNLAIGALQEGNANEAQLRLAELEREHPGQLSHARLVQQCLVALRRGERDAAQRLADRAVREPLPRVLGRGLAGEHVLMARALRALLRAASGDTTGTREDIAAVRPSSGAMGSDKLARVALAEALLLEQAGDRSALREHLFAERALLLDFTTPRERALVMALGRLVADEGTSSVYRNLAERDADESTELASWVAAFAPAAAPFVRVRTRGGATPATRVEPSEAARRNAAALRPAQVRASTPKSRPAVLLFGVYLAGAALVFYWLGGDGGVPLALSFPTVAAPLAAWGAWAIVRGRRAWSRLWRAGQSVARDDLDTAERELAVLRDQPGVLGAYAFQQLAEIAFRRGRFDSSLAETVRGLTKLAGLPRWSGEYGEALPAQKKEAAFLTQVGVADQALAAQRAVALAALDRVDDARAEVELSGQRPDGRLGMMVSLVQYLRAGRLEDAAAVFSAYGPERMLGRRLELLGELTLAACGKLDEAEATRLRATLRREPELGRWVDAIAPGLAKAVDRRAERSRPGPAATVAPQ
jgi:hypothetical protein